MTYIQTPTPNFKQSQDFYSNLGFKTVSDDPFVATDGKVFVEINPERTARVAIKLFSDDWSAETAEVEKLSHVVESNSSFHASDPNGVRVELVNGSFPFEYADESFGITGNFAGLSIEAFDPVRTVDFWSALGFEKTMGDLDQGWVAYARERAGISIMKTGMCPHLFTNPGLTYFNSGKNLENIEKLQGAGIPITEEITVFNDEGVVDNVIIHDPGGLGFFVFND